MPDDLEQRLTLFKREVLKRYFPHAGDFQADQARALAKNAPTVTRASSRESGLALLIAFVSAVLGIVCICIVSFEWQKAPASTTAFDGKYIGVSRESSKTASAPDAECPPPNVLPAPLTITNGVVRTPGKEWWEGTVNPHGAMVMRNPKFSRVDAQIGRDGTVKAQYDDFSCTVTFVWRKQSG